MAIALVGMFLPPSLSAASRRTGCGGCGLACSRLPDEAEVVPNQLEILVGDFISRALLRRELLAVFGKAY